MSGWMFFAGRQGERELAAFPAGAASLALANAHLSFVAGDQLFLGSPSLEEGAPFSAVQWLGRATAVTVAGLAFTRPLAAPVAAGMRVFKAAAWLELNVPGAWRGATEHLTGAVQARSVGGGWFTAQTAPPMQRAELRLSGLPPAARTAWQGFLDGSLQCGLQPFALFTPARRLFHARLAHGAQGRVSFAWSAQEAPPLPAGDLREQLTLPLFLFGEEVYP